MSLSSVRRFRETICKYCSTHLPPLPLFFSLWMFWFCILCSGFVGMIQWFQAGQGFLGFLFLIGALKNGGLSFLATWVWIRVFKVRDVLVLFGSYFFFFSCFCFVRSLIGWVDFLLALERCSMEEILSLSLCLFILSLLDPSPSSTSPTLY